MVDKTHRDPSKIELVGYLWSGKHKRTVKGINLIALYYAEYYTDSSGKSYPVNFQLYDKREHKNKNDYFIEMFQESKSCKRCEWKD